MSTAQIPQAVLSEALAARIGDRRVEAAVFLTFEFDPGFFEEEILPILVPEESFSHVLKVRLVQLEEALRDIADIAVYYDRRALIAGSQSARLDYKRIGVSRPHGYFHPKMVLMLVSSEQAEPPQRGLVVGVLSANLTRSGWWSNVEVGHFEEVAEGKRSSIRNDLLELISRVKSHDRTHSDHSALEKIREFLLDHVLPYELSRLNGRLLQRLYVGRESVPEFLGGCMRDEAHACHLEIISPFLDDADEPRTLEKLRDTLLVADVRVLLPEASDGTACCREELYAATSKVPGVTWGRLPESVLSRGSGATKESPRNVHAKVYRLWRQDREILFLGSVNLTRSAHQGGSGGNFEVGILVEPETVDPGGWWLKPLGDVLPQSFKVEPFEDAEKAEVECPLTLRFDWGEKRISYYWESTAGTQPMRARVAAQGVAKFSIDPIRFDEWVVLPPESGAVMEEVLVSTSLVEVLVDDREPWRLIVREDHMAQKPSILLSLSVEEILQYWSLLTPEQRQAFVEARFLADPRLGIVPPQSIEGAVPESMFDRFAGIFHAYEQLEKSVDAALQQGREKEAIYRIIGQKYDSLPSLVDKVIKDKSLDCVDRYVTLLCAKQFTRRLARQHPEFASEHRKGLMDLEAKLEESRSIRADLALAKDDGGLEFLDWFEAKFLAEAKPPAEED